MRRSYVAIYQDKKYNTHLYFDYEENEFFTIAERKNSGLVFLTSFVGIIFYSFMKNISFDIGLNLNPFSMVFISMTLGMILGFISVKLTSSAINNGLERRKKMKNPTDEQLKKYIFEGNKQFKTMVFMIIVLLFFSLLSAILLLFMSESVLLFISNIAMWAILILVIWLIRPIKRIQVYKHLKSAL